MKNNNKREVDQAIGDTHREVASCTKLFLEKDEMAECRSSGKQYSGVSRSARRRMWLFSSSDSAGEETGDPSLLC